MLEHILFDGCFVQSTEFKELSFIPGAGGSFVSKMENKIELAGITKNFQGTSVEQQGISSTVTMELSAHNVGDNTDEAFNLNIVFSLYFTLPQAKVGEITSEFIDENKWFFDNFAHVEAHRLISKTIEDTRYKAIRDSLPLNRESNLER